MSCGGRIKRSGKCGGIEVKILVTGGAGFIGSAVVRALFSRGDTVAVIVRENTDLWRFRDLISGFREPVKLYPADLRDVDSITAAVNDFKPDVVIHFATYYKINHQPQDIAPIYDTNVKGMINLLEACVSANVKKFVNTSTFFVYSRNNTNLSKETDDAAPVSLYALSKLQAEQVCTFYAREYGLHCITFRLFPPYGYADGEQKLIPHVIRSFLENKELKLTTGMQKWDYIFIDDIVRAYIAAVDTPLPPEHTILNLGCGNPVTIKVVINKIHSIVGSGVAPFWGAVPHRMNEVWFSGADIDKIRSVLHWKPMVSLDEGLNKTVEYYKNYLWRS